MRKNLERGLIVYEADVCHKEMEMELEIKRMRHRAKVLKNEADGIEEEADTRERQLELKIPKHARIADPARNTLQDLQQTKTSVQDVNRAVHNILNTRRRQCGGIPVHSYLCPQAACYLPLCSSTTTYH